MGILWMCQITLSFLQSLLLLCSLLKKAREIKKDFVYYEVYYYISGSKLYSFLYDSSLGTVMLMLMML